MKRPTLLTPLVVLAALAAPASPQLPARAATAAKEAARIHALIESLRPRALELDVDGRSDDWRDLPTFRDPGRQVEPAGLDIVEIGVAPVVDGVFVMVRPRGKAPREDGSFWINLDLTGEDATDFAIGICWTTAHAIEVHVPGRESKRTSSSRIRAAQEDVLEVFVPYDVLGNVVGAGHPLRDIARSTRSWVRARAISWKVGGEKPVAADHGLAAASFALRPTPYPLDSPRRQPGPRPRRAAFPLRGKWYVSQEAFGSFSHDGIWAWDFKRLDQGHHEHRGDHGRDDRPLTAFRAWNQPVLSPTRGVVRDFRDNQPDVAPGKPGSRLAHNFVTVVDGRGYRYLMSHLKHGSLVVSEKTKVEPGRELGRIGNSGYTTAPHLHLEVRDKKDRTVPIVFADVRVSLNPGECPWTRVLKTWEPRAGLFVAPN